MGRIVQICCLVFLSQRAAAQGSAPACPPGTTCRSAGQCNEFIAARKVLESLRRGSSKYNEKLRQLKSQVCNKKEKKVCCFQESDQEKQRSDSASWVPSRQDHCGVGLGSAGRVVGGNDTKLGEFPWAVLLGRKSSSGRIVWGCGGTLINRWFVLTAAHCKDSMDMVRLGEWEVVDTNNIKKIPFSFKCTAYNENQCGHLRCSDGCNVVDGEVDCASTKEGTKICGEKIQDIEVGQVRIHEDYKKVKSGLVVNDIALVKLRRPVELNKLVAPICLPTKEEKLAHQKFGEDGSRGLLSNGRPVVVGWGKTYQESDLGIQVVSSAKQQKLPMPVVSNAECSRSWDALRAGVGDDIRVGEHICAGGEKGKDSCNGDSGGALLGRDGEDNPYVLVGVVSAGTQRCGTGTPAIFARVAHYRDWIVGNLL